MSPKIIDPEILLTLSSIRGVGPNKLRALIGRFGTTLDILYASESDLTAVSGIDSITAKKIKNVRVNSFAKDQLTKTREYDARLITFWDEQYPEQLKEIYDPPAYLFVRGRLEKSDKFSLAIVGTRRPSNYGKLAVERLATELARKGLTIISGLAYGVDALAHTYALQGGTRTMAVLGSGVDKIYPNENRALAKRIIANGAILSEFPMGTDPDRNNFPRRNRIICGLSLGTLVIEAGVKSGALITAAMALEQNREVFAVPGNIDSPNSFGTNELIKQGAKIVTSCDDILDELAPQLGEFLRKRGGGPSNETVDESLLGENEAKILSLLTHEPQHIDDLARAAGQTTSQLLFALLSLELKNMIKQHAGKYFVRI